MAQARKPNQRACNIARRNGPRVVAPLISGTDLPLLIGSASHGLLKGRRWVNVKLSGARQDKKAITLSDGFPSSSC
ncbi:hypothetical protein BaRGS_00001670 [Batillaria attramentaria]|uniref:Ribosomal protein S12 n=1 Tax=Batillaria attramentaria TaxID=370345 RepID=A0ABD0M4R1_9CAEN